MYYLYRMSTQITSLGGDETLLVSKILRLDKTMFLILQEQRYEEACNKFTTAIQILGYKPDLSYNIALCHYMMKQYAPALKHIADIIEKGIREHPGNMFLSGQKQ